MALHRFKINLFDFQITSLIISSFLFSTREKMIMMIMWKMWCLFKSSSSSSSYFSLFLKFRKIYWSKQLFLWIIAMKLFFFFMDDHDDQDPYILCLVILTFSHSRWFRSLCEKWNKIQNVLCKKKNDPRLSLSHSIWSFTTFSLWFSFSRVSCL